MSFNLFDIIALSRINCQNFSHEIFEVRTDILGKLYFSAFDLLVELVSIGVFEGQVAAYHGK